MNLKLQYTCGPLINNSPDLCVPCASPVVKLIIFASVLGYKTPTVLIFDLGVISGMKIDTGELSVIP